MRTTFFYFFLGISIVHSAPSPNQFPPIAQISIPLEHYSTDNHAIKRTEVFVDGLRRTISEEKILEVFSSCGDIVEIRVIKDQKGNLKGFCFVQFATKEAAGRAMREKSGIMVDGKKIGVRPSTEQDTLYFGNLNKAWGADEFERIVLQVFPEVLSVDLPLIQDTQPGKKPQNRGFAFVKFASHPAAARAQRVGSQPDFRLGNLHPAVQWAEEEPEVDPNELAKIKIAFVRNLPVDADDNFLKQLFEPFGKVEKVVVSKRGRSPVGFVHFTERSELDRSIKELNGKTIQGRTGGSTHKLQVEVARPMDRNKKRAHDNSESNPSVKGHSKILKEESSSAPSNNHVQKESETNDPYEDAVIALPLAVTERLLRILRLRIATRFDIDIKSLCSLKELPESIAISILDQFMLSGAALQNKGAYLTGLISQHLDKVGQSQSLVSLSKVADISAKESNLFSFTRRLSPPAVGSFSYCADSMSRPNIYSSNYSSPLSDYPFSSRTLIGRTEERGSDFHISSRTISSVQYPRIGTLERSHSPLEATPPGSSIAYGNKVGLRMENVSPIPYTRREISLSSEIAAALSDRQATCPQARIDPSDIAVLSDRQATRPQVRINPFDFDRQATRPQVTFFPLDSAAVSNRQASRSQVTFDPFNNEPVSNRQETRSQVTFDPFNSEPVSIRQATRPQVRFDPFTGEPYKFDPFTGEPIQPESREREF